MFKVFIVFLVFPPYSFIFCCLLMMCGWLVIVYFFYLFYLVSLIVCMHIPLSFRLQMFRKYPLSFLLFAEAVILCGALNHDVKEYKNLSFPQNFI
jgi:hypothetical protein